MRSNRANSWWLCGWAVVLIGISMTGNAGGFGVSTDGEGYAARWDASTRMILGSDRSLQGGLSYTVSGGIDTFTSLFTFAPGEEVTAPEMQVLIAEAFGAWTATDPVTGLGTMLTFSFDESGGTTLDPLSGAEIDIIASDLYFDQFGRTEFGMTTRASVDGGAQGITLTSGVTGYGGDAIGGADIELNWAGSTWTRDQFRLLLTHEIGIALGLIDVDVDAGPDGTFFDDNYDGSSNALALATLTNAWAGAIDPLSPEGTPGIAQYFVADGVPGLDTAGVDIIMETQLPLSALGNLQPLSADDYAGRQFLYPVLIPEPSTAMLLAFGVFVFGLRQRARSALSGRRGTVRPTPRGRH